MTPNRLVPFFAAAVFLCAAFFAGRALSQNKLPGKILTGAEAFSNYETEHPGVFRPAAGLLGPVTAFRPLAIYSACIRAE